MAKTKPPPDAPPAEYTVVARRYRPQQFADLIGQEHVAQALSNAITSGRIAHAYLFTGARGVGKTSAARILAKALNCVKGPTPTPCDVCDICKSVANGDDIDVLEIDGASNNKVDEIRDLRANVGFRPARAHYKIYIIDEVHMLSTSAFNALLKTLEEPPPHVKFIFATTEVQKIPITILSRCQRFDFAHVGPRQIFETLRHIVGKEGLQAEDDALHLIARRANGSMRDSQSLLDQLLAFSDGILTAAKIHALLGTAGDERIGALVDTIVAHDAAGALGRIAADAEAGLHVGELLDQLVDYWRGMMLVLAAGAGYKDLPGTPSLQEKMRRHAKETNLDTVLAGLDILTSAKTKSRGSSHVQILLEMAVLRLARLDELLSVTQLAQMMAGGPSSRATEAAPPKKKPPTLPEMPPPPSSGPVALTSSVAAEVWPRVLDALGPMVANNIRAAGTPAIVGPNSLLLRFPSGYSSAYDYTATERSQNLVKAALLKVTGAEWLLRVEQDAGRKAEEPPAKRTDPKNELLRLPLFEHAAKRLGAQLVRMDDGFDPTNETPTPGLVPDTDEG